MKPNDISKRVRAGHAGFGLVEQIAALMVLAVAVAMAVPSFHKLVERHTLRTAQSDYIAALMHARNLAVNEQTRMILCPTRDGLRCSGQDTWNQGWLVGRADVKNAGQLLGAPRYVGQGYRDGLVIISSSSTKYAWFGPDGTASNTWFTLSFCMKDDPERVLSVVLQRTGRVRSELAPAISSPCAG